MHDILITRDSRGKIRIVDISCEWEDALHGFALVRKTSQMGGKITEQPIINIDRGKAGRTVTEQAKLTYNSHIKKYLDKGYKNLADFGVNSLENCDVDKLLPLEVTDTNGIRKPMLAKSADDCAISVFEHDFFGSRKLDGVRCLMYYSEGEIHTASRGGNNYDIATTHIISDPKLIAYFKENPTVMLDGELYIHGRSLPYISGLCRLQTLDEKHSELKYWIYDLAIPEVVFKDRLIMLDELKIAVDGSDKIVIVEHIPVSSWSNIKKLHDKFVKEGFEGCVIRNPEKEYGFNKRDNRMIKIKDYKDECFEVIDIIQGLRKYDDMVFVLKLKNGKTFEAKPIGNRELKVEYTENFEEKYKGQVGECKYFNYSPDGVPTQPVFKCFRYDIEL